MKSTYIPAPAGLTVVLTRTGEGAMVMPVAFLEAEADSQAFHTYVFVNDGNATIRRLGSVLDDVQSWDTLRFEYRVVGA